MYVYIYIYIYTYIHTYSAAPGEPAWGPADAPRSGALRRPSPYDADLDDEPERKYMLQAPGRCELSKGVLY